MIAAIFGYFYTVRPVHQKQRLDEEITQKTVELEHVKAQFEKAYSRLRKITVYHVWSAGYTTCSGIADRRQHPTVQTPRWKDIMDRDIATCMREQVADTERSSDLRPTDVKSMLEQFDLAAADIAAMRSSTMQEIKRLQSQSPDTLPAIQPPSPGTFSFDLEELWQKAGYKIERDTPEARLSHSLEDRAENYLDQIVKRLKVVQDMTWAKQE